MNSDSDIQGSPQAPSLPFPSASIFRYLSCNAPLLDIALPENFMIYSFGKMSLPLRYAASSILAVLAAGAIQVLGQRTNFVHSTWPLGFVVGAGAVTAVAGVGVGWLLGIGQGRSGRLALVGCTLFLGYMGIAGFMLNSGYYFWLVVPMVLVMQGLIAKLVIGASWRSILLVLGITVTYLLAGMYVSFNREDFGVTNENYFFFLIFLHPQLSLLLSRAWGGR